MGYGRKTGENCIYQNRRIGAACHGTGDLFSSTCAGEIMSGKNWRDAMRRRPLILAMQPGSRAKAARDMAATSIAGKHNFRML